MDEESYSFTPRSFQCDYSTISKNLKKSADVKPDRDAFVFINHHNQERRSLSCRMVYEQATTFAKGLISLGIQKGEVIAVGLPNIPEWPICTFGIILAGAVSLNFMFNRKDGSDLVEILNASGASAILFHPGQDDNNEMVVQNFTERSENGELCSTKIETLKHFIITQSANDVHSYLLMEDIMKLGKDNCDVILPDLDPDDNCMILLSSGSTGIPKMVPWSHHRMLSTGVKYINIYQSKDGDILFNDRPFNWIGGMPLFFLVTGNTRVTLVDLMALQTAKDIAEHAVEIIQDENCTVALLLAPCLMHMMQNITTLDNHHWPLKVVATGGAPLSPALTSVLGTITKTLANVYACTEIGLMSYEFISDKQMFCEYSVGKPVEGAEIKVVNDNGYVLPRGELGEIHVRMRERCMGYLADSVRTKRHFTHSGWYKTDDVGTMRENGSIIVQGRKSEVIIHVTYKQVPIEMKQLIKKHPSVMDVLILPVASKENFQDACACIMPYPTYSLTEEELKTFVEGQYIARNDSFGMSGLVPKYYIIFKSFPRTPVGKIDIKSVTEEVKRQLKSL